MKVVSFGGHDINDGENYRTFLTAPGQTPAETEPQIVGRTGAPAVIGGVVSPPRFLVLKTDLLTQTSASTKRELQQQWYAWFILDSTQSLIISDDDGQNQRYVEAMPFSIIHDADGDGWAITTTLAVDGDVLWRAVSATTYNWNITADGETLEVVNGDPAVNDDAYPVITITPRQTATGVNPYRRFAAVGWRATQPASNYPTDICNDGLDTQIASTNHADAQGDDIRVYVDGVEADYWLDGANTATTKVWVNLNFGAAQTATTAASMGTGAITTLTVNEAITNWPESGLFLIDSEVFSYTGKVNSTKTFTGVSRAARGTTAAAHDSADAVTWVQHEIWIEYGDATKTALVPDDDYKPMFLLTSTNGSWDYDEFYQYDGSLWTGSNRSGQWTRAYWELTHGGNQGTAANPFVELGLLSDRFVPSVKTAIDTAFWILTNPCGISAANFANGEFWHGRTDWFKAYVQYGSGSGTWTTEYTIPASTNSTWNAWSRNATGLPAGTNAIRLYLGGFCSASYIMRVECADVTVTLNSSYTPLVALGAEESTYRLQPTLVNTTTGESLAIDAAVDVDTDLEIDVETHQVTLPDGSDAYNAVDTVEGVRRWLLRLQAGSNTLRYDETGVVEVDVTVEFRRRYRV